MTGFAAFAGKEAREIVRTWRIWVLPGILLFCALTGPALARFTPEILGAVGTDQLGGLTIPAPTYLDAYAQWVKNLSQIVVIALVIIYGGVVSGEVRSGTAFLVLTKPVSRTAFVVAKATVQAAFVSVLVIGGTLLTWGVTAAFFGEAPGGALWSATGVWLASGILFVCLMTLLSSVIHSAAGAAGAGLGAYVLLSVAGIWQPLADYSPAGLGSGAASLAAGSDASVGWPVLTALVLAVACVAAAAYAFRRADL